jgi:hypothetical protein
VQLFEVAQSESAQGLLERETDPCLVLATKRTEKVTQFVAKTLPQCFMAIQKQMDYTTGSGDPSTPLGRLLP